MSDSIVQCFRRLVAERREEEALWSRGEGRRLSFGALETEAALWEDRLAGLSGRPIALGPGNCVAFVAAFLAARAQGVPVVLLDGSLPGEEKRAIAEEMGAEVLLHRDDGGDEAGDEAGDNAGGEPRVERVRSTGKSPARPLPPGTGVIKLTSGSTGRPAGACFDDASLIVGIRKIVAGMGIRSSDRVLLTIPLSHSYGFDNGMLSLAVHGTPLVLEPDFFPGSILRALEEAAVDVLPLVPPLVRSLGGSRWPEHLPLGKVICAGGVLLPETAADFHRASGLLVHDFYGSTETGGICFETSPDDAGARGTVGRTLPGVRVALDPEGRLTVDSAANLIGWVGEAERRTTRLVTMGDTARIEADGRIRLLGRTAHVLNIGGRKVAASRVEASLRAADGVLDAAVVGVDDPVRGDRTVGFLVTEDWPVDLSGVPRSSMPREIRRVSELPYTSRGKLDRGRLREMARRDSGAEREAGASAGAPAPEALA